MDNNPNIYNTNQSAPTGAPVIAQQPMPQGAVAQPVAPNPMAQQPMVPPQPAAFAPQYPQGYAPVGYNAQPPQPVPAFTPQPQYYSAPVQRSPYYVNQPVQQSPSAVYYNSQVVGVPQYHYGNPVMGGVMNNSYYEEQKKRAEERRREEKKYREIGNVSGIAALICFGFATIFSLLFYIDGFVSLYDDSLVGMSLVNMLYTLLVVGGSFFAFKRTIDNMGNGKALRIDNAPRNKHPLDFSGPKDIKKSFLIVLIGLGGCMIANYISSIILTVLEGFGIYSTYNSVDDPQNLFDVVTMFLATAIMPALIEEISLRGILMTPMRKFGNGFAILASAYVFGVFHGDAAQISFAFICGLFFGYAVVVTGSIWPAVIIHGVNNSLSCIYSVLVTYVSEDAGDIFSISCTAGFVILGGIALYLYLRKYRDQDFAIIKGEEKEEPLTFGKKFLKFATSPGMIVMTVLYVVQALSTLTTTPQSY